VLAAYNDHELPTERDVLLLRSYCPDYGHINSDELACMVIQEMVEQLTRARATRSNGEKYQMA